MAQNEKITGSTSVDQQPSAAASMCGTGTQYDSESGTCVCINEPFSNMKDSNKYMLIASHGIFFFILAHNNTRSFLGGLLNLKRSSDLLLLILTFVFISIYSINEYLIFS